MKREKSFRNLRVPRFPQAPGAIDFCHILTKVPNKIPEDYINRNDYHLIVLQGLVDNLFREIFVGTTRKSHDARIFKTQSYTKSVRKGSFFR